MATTKKGARKTRLDELRGISGPWGFAQIARACDVEIETAQRWAHDGRRARDKVVAARTGLDYETVWAHPLRRDPHQWRDWLAGHGVTDDDLAGVGVGKHMLMEPTSRLGRSDGWPPEMIIGWAQDQGRMDADGIAHELVPPGRPVGVEESTPRQPRNPQRAELRTKVVREYRRRALKGESDWVIRGDLAAKHATSRRQISRLLVEARRMPEVYGEIPCGSTARKPGSPRSIAAKTDKTDRTDRTRKTAIAAARTGARRTAA